MNPYLLLDLADQHHRDLVAAADRHRLVRSGRVAAAQAGGRTLRPAWLGRRGVPLARMPIGSGAAKGGDGWRRF